VFDDSLGSAAYDVEQWTDYLQLKGAWDGDWAGGPEGKSIVSANSRWRRAAEAGLG
jgi:hypothetical protein